jgi:hypothetical protein
MRRFTGLNLKVKNYENNSCPWAAVPAAIRMSSNQFASFAADNPKPIFTIDVINAKLDAIDSKLTIMANYSYYHRPFITGDKEK